MTLKRIQDTQIYYLSKFDDGIGEILMVGDIDELLNYVQTELIVNPADVVDETYVDENGDTQVISSYLTVTDFQNDAVFQDLGDLGVVATESKWYAVELNADLYQILLTKEGKRTSLPFRKTTTGSLPDLIAFVYSKFST